MEVQTEKFILENISWAFKKSEKIGLNHRQKTEAGLESVKVLCKGCFHSWVAFRHGKGHFDGTQEGYFFTCPECSKHEHVSKKDLHNG